MIRKYLKLAEIANFNIEKSNSRNQNLRGSTMGGVQRSRIKPEPHSRTLEFISRAGDLRHFVVEGIEHDGQSCDSWAMVAHFLTNLCQFHLAEFSFCCWKGGTILRHLESLGYSLGLSQAAQSPNRTS